MESFDPTRMKFLDRAFPEEGEPNNEVIAAACEAMLGILANAGKANVSCIARLVGYMTAARRPEFTHLRIPSYSDLATEAGLMVRDYGVNASVAVGSRYPALDMAICRYLDKCEGK